MTKERSINLTTCCIPPQDMALPTFIPPIVLALFAISSTFAIAIPNCTPGYFHTSSQGCLKCPPGTYQDQPDKTGCTPCTGNHFAPSSGSINCQLCSDNKVPSFFRNTCTCKPGFVPNAVTGVCEVCEAGYYVYTSSDTVRCQACTYGTYQPSAGSTECLECPKNSYSELAATKCLQCKQGEVPLGDGNCGLCPPGKTFETPKCVECLVGEYKEKPGQQPCLPCPMNGYSGEGAARCITCPDKMAPMLNGDCGMCSPGNFYDEEEGECVECRPGTFQPHEGVPKECYRCAGNSFSGRGAGSCVTCPIGQALMMNGSCTACPPGSSYDDSKLMCSKCTPGTYSHGTLKFFCRSCPKRTFSLYGSQTCKVCPDGTALLRTGDCGTCPPGTFYNDFDATCTTCYGDSVTDAPNALNSCSICPFETTANEDKTACS